MINTEFAKLYKSTREKSKKKIKICYHPNCNKQSINSHILQKNGIINQIADNKHIWIKSIDFFKENGRYFHRKGINNSFSFPCFCKEHDDLLFRKIEKNEIDFNDYESCLLFTLRTLYNEIYLKEVNIEQYKLLLKSDNISDSKINYFKELIEQEKLGISDLKKNEIDIWEDLQSGSVNFIFNYRKLDRIDICLAAFYNYETSLEMNNHILLYGKDMERISEVFINFFPYKNCSLLLMGYNKKDSSVLKSYFNQFFKESDNKVQIKISNLLLFACETWIISEKIYKNKILPIENIFINCIEYSTQNLNEREFFKVNIFKDSFINSMKNIENYVK